MSVIPAQWGKQASRNAVAGKAGIFRHSAASRNPEISTTWTPAFAGVTDFFEAPRSEVHQFLVISKTSAAEVRSQIHVALDAGYIDKSAFDILMNQADTVLTEIVDFAEFLREKWV